MRVYLHHFELEELLRGPHGPVVQEVTSRSRTVSNLAKRKVGVDTGRLKGSIRFTVRVQGSRVIGTVGSMVQYAPYHHEGTGIYGPRRQPIRPVKAKVLAFKPKGSRATVFATQVRGARPNPFLIDALREAVPWPVRINHLAL
ncbi:hypothetical protein [Nocardiopsis synnemataformans]|uniref:hypothetical protein n=1 Tax=Nocardiopsis synnemataformans TaxID=61305 RepID=UPI003EBC39DE